MSTAKPLLPWLDPLYDARGMRAMDSWAIEEQGVPSLDLMERAGEGVAQAVRDLAADGPVSVVCGKGNNGGDGFVTARLLHDEGREAVAYLLWPADQLSGDAEHNYERARKAGVPISELKEGEIGSAFRGVIVDAVFGTGFSGKPRGGALEAIEAINASPTQVVATDVPSGVDASTGEVEGEAVRATVTATFHAYKLGLWVMPGKAHAGDVRIVPIGIPAGSERVSRPSAGLTGPGALSVIPRRDAKSTKFTSGVLCIAGGSTGLTGAVCMAAEAAMRAGAGYVRAVVPASLNKIFETKLLEVMTVPAPDDAGSLVPVAVSTVLESCKHAGAAVLGPGLGRARTALYTARELIGRIEVPLLVDADGLFALVGNLDAVRYRALPTVLTPHAGELGRLLEVDSATINSHRLASAREAAERTSAVVVLKGDDTTIASPDGRMAISRGSAPGLATAGSGDVLAGVIGAFLAKGMEAFEAAAAGVYVHCEAGRVASDRWGADGLVAGDVIDTLPGVIASP